MSLRSARRWITIILAAVVLIGSAALLLWPRPTATEPGSPLPPAGDAPAPPPPGAVWRPVSPASDDPETFAVEVMTLLYAWHAVAGGREAIREVLLEVGDPSGAELNGLRADTGRHLPSDAAWTQLLELDARQTLDVDTVLVPSAWHRIAAQNDLPPELIAVTVTGTRHREGTWVGETVRSEHPVAATLFLSCPPAQRCAVLRVSEPGQTLP